MSKCPIACAIAADLFSWLGVREFDKKEVIMLLSFYDSFRLPGRQAIGALTLNSNKSLNLWPLS